MTIEDLLQTPRDIVLQIMSQHWDLKACECWVCVQGYRLGCRTMDRHLRYKMDPEVARQLTDVRVEAPR
jgi:hypothetical protein